MLNATKLAVLLSADAPLDPTVRERQREGKSQVTMHEVNASRLPTTFAGFAADSISTLTHGVTTHNTSRTGRAYQSSHQHTITTADSVRLAALRISRQAHPSLPAILLAD